MTAIVETSSSHVLSKLINASALKKGLLFSSLYLTQTVPKGYLKFLPILMAEKGDSMKSISFIALLSFSDSFKPLYGVIFDSKLFNSNSARKNVILGIQLLIISIFLSSMTIEFPKSEHLASLFALSNILTSIHDTAVDGLAVNFLKPSEHSFGAFGQYAGYKLGTLLVGGIIPALVGTDHKTLCKGIVGIMIIVFVFTASYNMSDNKSSSTNNNEFGSTLSASKYNPGYKQEISHVQFIRDFLFSYSGMSLVFTLLLYKAADHGLDFIWGPMLVHSKISRKDIVKTQFVLGTIAAIVGALGGTAFSSIIGDKTSALGILSLLRLIPGLMQFMYATNGKCHTISYIATHAILENMIGSAVTCVMFSYLLQCSDKRYPATSYAFMNAVALMGMNIGEYSFSQMSHYFSFPIAISVGIGLNLMFPISLAMTEFLRKLKVSKEGK